MRQAISLARESVKKGGGPFGAVIVKDGRVVAASANSVTLDNDPTAHAEINTIRAACRRLGTFDLSGCVIYSSCEPCPMCLGALYWAHVDAIWYGGTRADADAIGFGDDFIYREIALPAERRSLPMQPLLRDEALAPFRDWREKADKTPY